MIDLPDLKALREHFDEHGYAVVEGLFEPELVRACDEAVFDHYSIPRQTPLASNFKAAQCEVISWAPVEEGVDPYVRVAEHPGLAMATRAVLDGPYDVVGSLIMCSPPQSIGQAWHQDCQCDNPAHYNLNRLLYTHDIGDNGGEVVLVPGSHRQGELPPGEPHGDLPGQLVLAPTAGTLVFLHGMTYHRVLPVRSRPRISSNFRVVPQGTPRDITNVATYRNMKYRFSTAEVLEVR